MVLMLWIPLIIPLVVTPIVVVLGVDPLFDVFPTYHEFSFATNIAFILTRYGILMIIAPPVTVAINAFFIVGLMLVCPINDILTDLIAAPRYPGLRQRFQEIKLYFKILIWNKYANQNFCSFSVPPLIFLEFR